jgi:hypothetical protein
LSVSFSSSVPTNRSLTQLKAINWPEDAELEIIGFSYQTRQLLIKYLRMYMLGEQDRLELFNTRMISPHGNRYHCEAAFTIFETDCEG